MIFTKLLKNVALKTTLKFANVIYIFIKKNSVNV